MTRICTRFLRSNDGSILMIVGLALFVLVALAGAGIDFGRQSILRTELQHAADSAATSAASVEGVTNPQRDAIARRYFTLNFSDEAAQASGTTVFPFVTFPVTNGQPNIAVAATGNIDTTFISNVGQTFLPAAANSVVPLTKGQAYDIALAFNMSQTEEDSIGNPPVVKVDALKLAGTVINNTILTPANKALPKASQSRLALSVWDVSDFGKDHDAVHLTTNANDIGMSLVYMWPRGPKGIMKKINSVFWDPKNRLGLALASGMPGWLSIFGEYGGLNDTSSGFEIADRLLWGNANPSPNPQAIKVVILVTDGLSTVSYTNSSDNVGSQDALDDSSKWSVIQCERMKAKGTLIYTVALGDFQGTDPSGLAAQLPYPFNETRTMLSECATNGVPQSTWNVIKNRAIDNQSYKTNLNQYYYEARTSDELSAVMQKITTHVKKIRIAQ